MRVVAAWGTRHSPDHIFPVLVEAAAWLLLHADERVLTRADGNQSKAARELRIDATSV